MSTLKNIVKMIPGMKSLYYLICSVLAYIFYSGDTYTCLICDRSFRKLIDLKATQVIYSPYTNLTGKRENAMCPNCRSLERLRLVYLYLIQHTNMFTTKNKILHFAPERSLVNICKKSPNIEYYSADIKKGCAMYAVDIMNICFGNEEFDYVVLNHVLEHVSDDIKALTEVLRILKPGGKAIITVPISPTNKSTLEQPTVSDDERLTLYGQHDHVRLYGMDFPERMQEAGFKVDTFIAGTNVPLTLVEQYALLIGETVYIGEK
ncbi:MAG: methyltransferase domain-containing protein [Oscillospiraceae bacterium]|jgi:SAM-dependent methyltransferase|nr:methyltransferase domain-containing protein [Oscillospiraceae bacterium]